MSTDILKSKMTNRVGYKKGTVMTDPKELVSILGKDGTVVEVKAQEIRYLDKERVEVLECRIFFKGNNDDGSPR
jgi:hypothetical protein